MNRNIIIVAIIIVLIAIVGIFVFSQPQSTDGKINTQINFLNQATLKNGDQVQMELKDAQGNALAGENLNITYKSVSTGVEEKYSVITDASGKAYLTISGEDAGEYNITVDYGGNDKYNGCIGHLALTVEEGTSDASAQSTDANSSANTVQYNNQNSSSSGSGQSSSEQLYYDSQINAYYDSNGIVRGGQSDGSSIEDLRAAYNDPNMIDEEGNLQ